MSFGTVDIIEIESENQGTKPNISHDLTYSHSHDYSLIDARVASDVAISKALRWHTAICCEYGLSVVNSSDGSGCGSVFHAGDQSPKSVASAIYEPGVRRWLVDAGCPFDLIARRELDGNEADFVKKASKYVRMATPSGIVDADRMITFRVPSLGDPIDAYVMESTPTVMSIGRRCMQLGYTFVWNGYKNPFIIAPGGKKIQLQVIDYVPYLPVCKSTPCASAVAASGTSSSSIDLPPGVRDDGAYEIAN